MGVTLKVCKYFSLIFNNWIAYLYICGQPFPRKDALKRHYKKCQDRATTDNKDIEDKMTKFFDDNSGPYQNQFKEYASKEICHQCSKPFTTKSALKTHMSH